MIGQTPSTGSDVTHDFPLRKNRFSTYSIEAQTPNASLILQFRRIGRQSAVKQHHGIFGRRPPSSQSNSTLVVFVRTILKMNTVIRFFALWVAGCFCASGWCCPSRCNAFLLPPPQFQAARISASAWSGLPSLRRGAERTSPVAVGVLPRRYGASAGPSLVSSSTNSTDLLNQSKMRLLLPMVLFSACLLLGFPFPSAARGADPYVFTNDYDDPFHPLCERHIEVSADGASFKYTGTAVGPKGEDAPVGRGCSPQEIQKYGLRLGAFDGKILPPGNRISAGDGIHEGLWEPAGSARTNLGYEDNDGIRWNDGNKWTVRKAKPEKSAAIKVGETIFYSYIGVSTLAGAKGLYDGVKRQRKRKSP